MVAKMEKIVYSMALWAARVAQVALAAVMFVIVTNVLMRAVWKPLPGTYELVEIGGAVLLSLGVAYCAVMKGHVAVEVLVEKLPLRLRALVEGTTSLIAFVFAGAIGYDSFVYSARVMGRGYATGHLSIPLYPFYYLVSFGLIILALVLLIDFVKTMFKIFRGES